MALRVRWPWLKKSEPSKPWATLPLHTSKEVDDLLSLATTTEIGDGANTLFWKDRWLSGKSVQSLAPNLFTLVSKRRANRRTVLQALRENKWIEDIQGEIPAQALLEYLALWDTVEGIVLQEGIPDKHIWRFSASGEYTAKSAYDILFEGAISFAPYERIWNSWAPPKCRFFLWLVAHNRCWTADRLARRGLPHPEQCPLCDQVDESIQHLLIGCVFARQFWFVILHSFGLAALAPQPTDSSFDAWWEKTVSTASGEVRKGLNSLVILGAWTIWKHRNDCVFNGATPSLPTALTLAREEALLWSLAGAKGLDVG